MKIDLLVCKNPSGSTFHFAQALQRAFLQKGVRSNLFRIDNGHFFRAFYTITEDPPDFTCSFSEIKCAGKLLCDQWQIPHLSLLVDPAIYFLHHVKSPYSWISCIDEEDCSFLERLDFQRTFFLAHGGDPHHLTSPQTERPYKKVFFGSCLDFEAIKASWREKYPAATFTLLKELSEWVLSSDISTLTALLSQNIPSEKLPLFYYEIDRYTKGRDRVELLRGKQVDIWGKGPWQKYCPDACIHPPISFRQALQIMKKAQVVFNSSPRFKEGSHERIFYALLCGAAVVTAENKFLQKAGFTHDELFLYRLNEREFETDFSDAKRRAFNGQQKVLAAHTWEHRATTLMNYMRNQVCQT